MIELEVKKQKQLLDELELKIMKSVRVGVWTDILKKLYDEKNSILVRLKALWKLKK